MRLATWAGHEQSSWPEETHFDSRLEKLLLGFQFTINCVIADRFQESCALADGILGGDGNPGTNGISHGLGADDCQEIVHSFGPELTSQSRRRYLTVK